MKETLPTARQFLVAEGLAKDGRGKFSGAAHARLREAAANGQKFSDWPKEEIVITHTAAGKKKKQVTVKAVPKETVSYETRDKIFPGTLYKFVGNTSGKETGESEACGNCGHSLCHCFCRFPYALVGSHSEVITRISRESGRETFPPQVLTSPRV